MHDASMDTENEFKKTQYIVVIKYSQKIGMEVKNFNLRSSAKKI